MKPEAAIRIMAELNAQDHKGSVVSMRCDPGDRNLDTYYSTDWLDDKGFGLKSFLVWPEPFYDCRKWGWCEQVETDIVCESRKTCIPDFAVFWSIEK